MAQVDNEANPRAPHPPKDAREGALGGSMGVVELMFTVLASNAPVVVFLGFIPVAILLGNGLAVPVAIITCGLLIASLSSAIVVMASHLDRPGGFYAIVTAGPGRVVGLGAGFTGPEVYARIGRQ